MTSANQKAIARVADAEKRARRKLDRLDKNGVRTGSINPLRRVDYGNTRELNRYYGELEKFISRKNRYVAGNDGQPLPYDKLTQYRKLEQRYNKLHDKHWKDFAPKPYLTSKGKEDVTLGELSSMVQIKGLAYKGIDYRKQTPNEKIRGISDLNRRITILKNEVSPNFQKKRIQTLRKNLIEHVSGFNDEELTRRIRGLTNEELFRLQNETSFVPLFYRYISTDKDNDFGLEADSTEHQAQIDHIKLTIDAVRNTG